MPPQHRSPAHRGVPCTTSVRPVPQRLAAMMWLFAFRVSGSIRVSLWCIERREAHFCAVPFLATPAFAIGVDQAGIGATAAWVIRHKKSCYQLSTRRDLDAAASKPRQCTVTRFRQLGAGHDWLQIEECSLNLKVAALASRYFTANLPPTG